MSLQQSSVTVTIFGTEYPVKGDGDSAYIYQIAQYVDAKMTEIAQGQKTHTDRIAILAALNIADELFQARTDRENTAAHLTEECQRLTRQLEEHLGV